MCCHLHWVQPLRPVHRARGQGQQLVRHPVLTLKRKELLAANACRPWLLVFDQICNMSVDPGLVHTGTLEIELTPLAYLWAARDAAPVVIWLRNQNILGPAGLRCAKLNGLSLSGAFLCDADFMCAELKGCDLSNSNLQFACLRACDLRGAQLQGAKLAGADFTGARRNTEDHPIQGWNVYRGYLVEHNP